MVATTRNVAFKNAPLPFRSTFFPGELVEIFPEHTGARTGCRTTNEEAGGYRGKKKAIERGEIERERARRGMAEKFLERRKEPGKMNSVSLRQRGRKRERERG